MMNTKIILTVAGLAVVALVGYGAMTKDQGDQAENAFANFSDTTQQYMSDMSASIDEDLNEASESLQEVAQDVEETADEAYEAAVREMQELDAEMQDIQPAAGEVENEIEEDFQN